MSALSIPPSQKANKSNSIGLESIHNYANVVNPIAFVNTDQYSVVAIYTETEASEAEQDLRECAEMQIQTDFYEEEIVAVSVAGAGSLRPEETSETVDVAKALDTLTKAFALKKDNISQEAQREKSKDELGSGSASGKEETCDLHGIPDLKENVTEEEIVDPQPEDLEMNSCSRFKDNLETLSVHETVAVYTHDDPVLETQQALSLDSLQAPSPTQSSDPFRLQDLGKISESSCELPVMYEQQISMCKNV